MRKLLLHLIFMLGITLIFPTISNAAGFYHRDICTKKSAEINCMSKVATDMNGKPMVTLGPVAYGPQQIQTAYGYNNASASGRILAIVDAYDQPNIKVDLDTYNNKFGLPYFPDCGGSLIASSSACFMKVDQSGGKNYPVADSGWGLEISLDVEAAHGVCPSCKILLVEAKSASFSDLMAAVDTAVSLGATAVSNSYGASEFMSETTYDYHFNKPGVAFTVSSGDSGYGTMYPAASQFVTAVGGTSLRLYLNNSISSETAWSKAGSGCSKFEKRPLWQPVTSCLNKVIADVSAVADPDTGMAIYTSFPYMGQTGWFRVGGTSLASPIIAAGFVLKGVPPTVMAASIPFVNPLKFNDITVGLNGYCGFARFLCTAGVGFDGPTGLGTPKGIDGL